MVARLMARLLARLLACVARLLACLLACPLAPPWLAYFVIRLSLGVFRDFGFFVLGSIVRVCVCVTGCLDDVVIALCFLSCLPAVACKGCFHLVHVLEQPPNWSNHTRQGSVGEYAQRPK